MLEFVLWIDEIGFEKFMDDSVSAKIFPEFWFSEFRWSDIKFGESSFLEDPKTPSAALSNHDFLE